MKLAAAVSSWARRRTKETTEGAWRTKKTSRKNGGTTDTRDFEGLREEEEINDDGEANMKQRNDEDGEEWKKTKMEEERGCAELTPPPFTAVDDGRHRRFHRGKEKRRR